jgi:hypothetical protein
MRFSLALSLVLCAHSSFCVNSSSEAIHEGVVDVDHRLLDGKTREHVAAARPALPMSNKHLDLRAQDTSRNEAIILKLEVTASSVPFKPGSVLASIVAAPMIPQRPVLAIKAVPVAPFTSRAPINDALKVPGNSGPVYIMPVLVVPSKILAPRVATPMFPVKPGLLTPVVPFNALAPSVATPIFPEKPGVVPNKPVPVVPIKAVEPSVVAPKAPRKPGVVPIKPVLVAPIKTVEPSVVAPKAPRKPGVVPIKPVPVAPIKAVEPSGAAPTVPGTPGIVPIKPVPVVPIKAIKPSGAAPTVPVKPGAVPKLSIKPNPRPSHLTSALPTRKPSSRNQTRASSAPSCSFITETIYLETSYSVTFSDNFLEVEFSSVDQLTAFQIVNYNDSFIDACYLYGYVGGEWSFLTSKLVNDNKLVYFPPAAFQRYRLTFQKIYPSKMVKDNIRFLRLYTAQCDKENSFQFFTKDELQGIVLRYTDVELKKQVIKDYGVMNCWDVSKVTDMSGLFSNIIPFDEDISCWDTSKVRNMSKMFFNAQSFNHDLGRWNVSEVGDFSEMFTNAKTFHKPLSRWAFYKVKSMVKMFYNAATFNQDLCSWYNKISIYTLSSNIFGLSSCIDKSEPNITSKTSFCTECSCCGGACFYPVGRCEDGYTCDKTSSSCRKPINNETCRLPRGDSYGCKNGYTCSISYGSGIEDENPYRCTNPTINSSCVEEIGCIDGLQCSGKVCKVSHNNIEDYDLSFIFTRNS